MSPEGTSDSRRAIGLGSQNWFWAAVAAITTGGALLRIAYQSGRSFSGDEIGTLRLLDEPYLHLLSTFRTWLSMNFFLAAEKFIVEVLGSREWTLVALPLAAGIATIPLAALLGRRLYGPLPGLASTALVAIHPELVQRSVQIRSYSLLVFLTLLCVLAFERWLASPSCRRGSAFAIATTALILSHPNGAYPIAALLLFAVGRVAREGLRGAQPLQALRASSSILLPTAAALALVALAYWPIYPEMRDVGRRFRSTPPTSIDYLAESWPTWFGSGVWSWPTLALCLLGCWRLLESRNRSRYLLLVIAIGPIMMSLQGLDHYPWAMTRFLLYTLPILLMLAVVGLDWSIETSNRFRSPKGRVGPLRPQAMALAIGCLLLALTWMPGLASAFSHKTEYPWRNLRALVSELEGPTRVIGLHFIDNLQMDVRPEGYGYATSRVFQLRPTRTPEPAANTVLVARDIELDCVGARRLGKIGYVILRENSEQETFRRAHQCLLETVRGEWQTAAQYVDLYDTLLIMERRLGMDENSSRYIELREVSRSFDRRYLEHPPRMREERARRVSDRWRQTTEAGVP